VVVEICIFRNTEGRTEREKERESEIPTKLARCLFLYLESSADDTLHVCGLKRVRSKLSRYKLGRVKSALRGLRSFSLSRLIWRNSLRQIETKRWFS